MKNSRESLDDPEETRTGVIKRPLDVIEKPLEVYYEQIAKRNATGLASVEKTEEKRKEWFEKFYQRISEFELYSSRSSTLRCRCRIQTLRILTVM